MTNSIYYYNPVVTLTRFIVNTKLSRVEAVDRITVLQVNPRFAIVYGA